MKKLKTLLQHNILYYVLFFIVMVLYFVSSYTTHISLYDNFDNEKFIITNITYKDYGIKLELKGREKVLGFIYDNNYISNFSNNYELGDKVLISGDIMDINSNTVPNTFNYKKYLKSNGIYNVIEIKSIKKVHSNSNIFYKIKNNLIKRLSKLYKSGPYINSLVLGDNSLIDEDILSSYRENGISHLFAISGLHISIFIMLLGFLFDRIGFSFRLKSLLIIVFLLFYMFITNFSMSVLRSAIFTILLILNKGLDFNIKPTNLLILTLVIIMFINPLYLNNIGLLYSFLISFFLISFSYLLKGNKIYTIFITSVISFLVSYPITVNNFYEVNILSIIYNMFFIPYVSFILMPLILTSYMFPFLDNVLYFFITILEKASHFLEVIDIGKISLCKMSTLVYIIYFVVLYFFLRRFKCHKKLFFVFFALVITIHSFLPLHHKDYVMFFDVGQGDSSLISIDNTYTLIDTGGKVSFDNMGYKYPIAKNKLIPYFKSVGIPYITNIIISHGDQDHARDALYLIENFKVKSVIFNCGVYNDLEKDLIKVLNKKDILYDSCVNELNIGKYKLKFLNTKEYDNENDNSNVIYLNYEGYKFLFMGDAGIEKEKDILEKYKLENVDFIKIGHHGSNTSSSKEFINKFNPKYSLISVGKNNRYGHPKDEVLETLNNSKIYRTDLDGSIEIKLNKNGYKIRTCPP